LGALFDDYGNDSWSLAEASLGDPTITTGVAFIVYPLLLLLRGCRWFNARRLILLAPTLHRLYIKYSEITARDFTQGDECSGYSVQAVILANDID
jgi:hypothetical protein